ncbi:MAG: Ig domain-containing protein, partial [Fimbriiglobus sp.]
MNVPYVDVWFNRAPTLTNPNDRIGVLGDAVTLQLGGTDADGDKLTYSATGLPAGLTLNASTGQITGRLTALGSSEVTVTTSDAFGGKVTTSFTWTVDPARVWIGGSPAEMIAPGASGAVTLFRNGDGSQPLTANVRFTPLPNPDVNADVGAWWDIDYNVQGVAGSDTPWQAKNPKVP